MKTSREIAIVGVTGFVGRGLPPLLNEMGFEVIGVSRSGKGDVPGVSSWQTPERMDFDGCQAVINLAGDPIDKRWTEANRRRFHESRVGTTAAVVEAIAKLPESARPEVLVNASAVGIYGDRGDETLIDTARPGRGYLASLCTDWEHAAQDAETLGVRVVRLRIGVVLGKEGAAFAKLRKIFGLGIGGRLGSGKQWMPWIHVHDLRASILHAISSNRLAGPVNASSPDPRRNADFTKALGNALHRPAILPAPAFALRLLLGEFSSALLEGQNAVPAALEADGFIFKFPDLESALADLVGQ